MELIGLSLSVEGHISLFVGVDSAYVECMAGRFSSTWINGKMKSDESEKIQYVLPILASSNRKVLHDASL